MEVGSLLGDLQGTLRLQRINLEKIMSHSPENRTLLGAAAKDFDEAVDDITDISDALRQQSAATAGELERLSVMLQSEVARFSV